MEIVLLPFYLAALLVGCLGSVHLTSIDIKRHHLQEQPNAILRYPMWTTVAAFVFDSIQICVSVAGIVAILIALSSQPAETEVWWLHVVIICYLQLLNGNYVRYSRLFIFVTKRLTVPVFIAFVSISCLESTHLICCYWSFYDCHAGDQPMWVSHQGNLTWLTLVDKY